MEFARWICTVAAVVTTSSACRATSVSPNEEARLVFSPNKADYCSIVLHQSQDTVHPKDHLLKLLTFIQEVRRTASGFRVTYMNYKTGRDFTLTGAGSCGAIGGSLLKAANSAGSKLGIKGDQIFTPKVISLPDSERSLRRGFAELSPDEKDITKCSRVLQLSPSQSAEDDRAFNMKIGSARDVFGVPILFAAQENRDLYVTFFHQCDDIDRIIDVVHLIVEEEPKTRVGILSARQPTVTELAKIYGPVF